MKTHEKNVIWMATLTDHALLIAVNGEWDLSAADDLEEIFDRVGTNRDVVLDLRGVTFMDSTILSKIILLHKRLAADGRRLETISTGMIKRLFAIVSLDRIMGISPRRLEWVDAFRTRPPAGNPVKWQV